MTEREMHDWWWCDLPERGIEAAHALGYTKEIWDNDEETPYDDKDFKDCTCKEKQAAMYLGMSPIDDKCDIWWEETDEATKKAAEVLGWDKHKWDHDWSIHDLPCEHWWWKDMTPEQKDAARHFGYNHHTWDHKDFPDEPLFEDEDRGAAAAPPAAAAEEEETPAAAAAPEPVAAAAVLGAGMAALGISAAPAQTEEEADPDTEEEDVEEEPAAADAEPDAPKKKKKKMKFKSTRYFGGPGGIEWDHGNNRCIKSITVNAGSHIDGISVTYHGGFTNKAGGDGGAPYTLDLDDGEYINAVIIKCNKMVQDLTFKTSKGNQLGPTGGTGHWLKDKLGDEQIIKAPNGMQLCGLKGRAGVGVDAIAFRWGSIPE